MSTSIMDTSKKEGEENREEEKEMLEEKKVIINSASQERDYFREEEGKNMSFNKVPSSEISLKQITLEQKESLIHPEDIDLQIIPQEVKDGDDDDKHVHHVESEVQEDRTTKTLPKKPSNRYCIVLLVINCYYYSFILECPFSL